MGERDLQRLPGGELEAVVEVLAREDRVAVAARLEHGRAVEGAAADHRLAAVLCPRRSRCEQQDEEREREQSHVAALRPSTLAAISPTTIPPTTQPSTISQPHQRARIVAVGSGDGGARTGCGTRRGRRRGQLTGGADRLDVRPRLEELDGDLHRRRRVEPLAAQMLDLDAEGIGPRRVARDAADAQAGGRAVDVVERRAPDRLGLRHRCRVAAGLVEIELERAGPVGAACRDRGRRDDRPPPLGDVDREPARAGLGRELVEEEALPDRRRLLARCASPADVPSARRSGRRARATPPAHPRASPRRRRRRRTHRRPPRCSATACARGR